MSNPVRQILETFPVLTPDMAVEALPWTGDMAFYEGLESRFNGFSGHVLVSCHEFDEPWPTWECHPHGDELVILLGGSATMVIQQNGERRACDIRRAGEYIIVPRGAWHTASAASAARMLFITPGEGTQNVEQPPADN